MKEGRDFALVFQINEHYKDLKEDMKSIFSLEDFVKGQSIRRAILFDFLQIGELFNHLSSSFIKAFNNKHSTDLIDIRNRIVHGYGKIKDSIIYGTITKDFDVFIESLNCFAKNYYFHKVQSLIGTKVPIIMEEQGNSGLLHYKVGYTEIMTTLDGYFQKTINVDDVNPVHRMLCYVIGVMRLGDEMYLLTSSDKEKRISGKKEKQIEDEYDCVIVDAALEEYEKNPKTYSMEEIIKKLDYVDMFKQNNKKKED